MNNSLVKLVEAMNVSGVPGVFIASKLGVSNRTFRYWTSGIYNMPKNKIPDVQRLTKQIMKKVDDGTLPIKVWDVHRKYLDELLGSDDVK